ncbi:hypothetical protein B296_00002387 [Ensete ventricosum]|uniref:Uncharacterized protein n=1 Tax=Ensete ventricosum TaxID=4639 RepID=A0A427AG27_ENSVE|nr:hypothetical protein B296_00002387 [Ensete ventricosum]
MRAVAGEKEEAASNSGWQRRLATGADRYDQRQCKGHLRFHRGGEEDDGRQLGKEAVVERSSTYTARERGERPPMERKETNLPTMCSGTGAIGSDGCGRGKKKHRRLMLLLQHLSLQQGVAAGDSDAAMKQR